MARYVLESCKLLERYAGEYGAVTVAYSGGKDSLAVMDLCCKVFPKGSVRAFMKVLVDGLEVEQQWIRYARNRWGVDVTTFHSELRFFALRRCDFCDPNPKNADVPAERIPLKWSYAYGLSKTGTGLLATGMKAADGLKRRHFFANTRDSPDPFWRRVIHPIQHWKKSDVLSYLKVNRIQIPASRGNAVVSGVGLDPESVCWLHDCHPDDFRKLEKVFPYVGAMVKRRDWFDIPSQEQIRAAHEEIKRRGPEWSDWQG